MRREIELILLGCLTKRTENEEKRLNELLELKEDWAFITGELIRHRVNGNFYTSLSVKQKQYIIGKVSQTFGLLGRCYEEYNKYILCFFQELIRKTDEAGIIVAGLKGSVYNTSIYGLNVRRSNDLDVLVAEEDLKVFDEIMRELEFVQSLDEGKTEATRKQKIIQVMNYHDLVPYIKVVNDALIDYIKVDVNFHFDSKDHDITRSILDAGTQDYTGNGYVVRGLKWTSHLLHLCIHFYREATNSIWTSRARDVDLYKIVDIQNTMRCFSKEQLIEWCDCVDEYQLNKQCYFTIYYLNKFYADDLYKDIMEKIKPDDVTYLTKIETKGGVLKERDMDFFDFTFDMNYGKNFFNVDFSTIF